MKNRFVTGMGVKVTVEEELFWVNSIARRNNLKPGYGLKKQNLNRLPGVFLIACGFFLFRCLCKFLHKVAFTITVHHGPVFVFTQLFAYEFIIGHIFKNRQYRL